MANNQVEDEFRIGRGRADKEDDFRLKRLGQKAWNIGRFSSSYVNACYSTAPQAVYKIISFGRGISAKKIMEYVNTREGIEQTFHTESGEELKGKEDIDQLYQNWSSEFRKKGSGRGEQRHVTHMLLSADVEGTENNADKVLAAARDTLWQSFGREGFEYTFVLHTDTEHPHVHAIVKNYNSQTKRKLRLDRHDLLQIRTDFAKTMTDFGLKKHVATLRRDRPTTLHRVEESMKRMHGQKQRMDHLLNECAFINRKTQLNGQLSKKVGITYDYQHTKLNIVVGQHKHVRVKANKAGKPFEDALKFAVANTFKGVARSNVIYDKDIPSIEIAIKRFTPDQLAQVRVEFKRFIDNKQRAQDKKMAQRTKDVLPQYRSVLLRTDKAIKWVRWSKLSPMDKSKHLKELKTIKKQLLNNYDLKAIQDASTLATGNVNLNVFKELEQIEKQPSARDFLKRKKALENWVDKQKGELGNRVKYYKSLGDKKTATLLKGMQSGKSYQQVIRSQTKVNEQIISKNR